MSRNSSRLLNDKTATIEDHYRLFMIPGMSHCRDGEGPWHFGSKYAHFSLQARSADAASCSCHAQASPKMMLEIGH